MATHPAHRERRMPDPEEMVHAFLGADTRYDGVFVTAVKTTGIFCRPSCPARKPKVENVEFFATITDALFAGYRPCKRCRPLESPRQTPAWVSELIAAVNADPTRRWRDQDLRDRGIEPARARRWFKACHGMTFHAFARSMRLGGALRSISEGSKVTNAAIDHGYDSLSAFGVAVKRLTQGNPTESRAVIRITRIDTPLGPMIAGAHDEGLCLLEFSDRRALQAQVQTLARRFEAVLVPGADPILAQIEDELARYFAGKLARFATPLALRGTPFQESVWNELLKIPSGQTQSYGEIAAALGQPNAVRAVGTANGANRIAIVVPCHRVIGADGRLTGYGGGLWRKERLLELEGARR